MLVYMSKKKAVDIAAEETTSRSEVIKLERSSSETTQAPVEEKPIEETVVEPEPIIEQPKEEEQPKTETPKNDDDHNIKEIIREEAERPRETLKTKERKTVVCPKCSKVLLEKNYKYSHQAVCGKVKVKPVMEEAVQEPTPKPATVEQLPPPPPPAPDYWELRRQYNNHLKDRKTQLVKKLVSKAF